MAIVLSYHGNRESEAALQEALRLADVRRTSVVVVLARRESEDDARTAEDAEELLWSHLRHADIPFEIRHTQRMFGLRGGRGNFGRLDCAGASAGRVRAHHGRPECLAHLAGCPVPSGNDHYTPVIIVSNGRFVGDGL